MRICESAADARTLRLRLLEEIRRAVSFDAYAWLLTDPETSVGSAPLADVPCLPELPRLIALKYLTRINRWTSLHAAPAALLHEATGGDLSRSLLWQDLQSRYAVTDVASLVFRDRFGCWGFLDLWRSGAPARFGPAEAAFLGDIAGPVTAALRRSQARAFTSGGGSRSTRRPGPVVLLLSPALVVLRQTPETQEYLRILVPPAEDRPPIPASAYNVAAQLLAVEAGVDGNPPWARVHMSDGVWVHPPGGPDRQRRRPCGKRHCRHDRRDDAPRTGGLVRPGVRVERTRERVAQPSRYWRRHPGTRAPDVPVRAHRSGPPEVNLRENLGAQPPDLAVPRAGLIRCRSRVLHHRCGTRDLTSTQLVQTWTSETCPAGHPVLAVKFSRTYR